VFSAVHSKGHLFDTGECALFTSDAGLDHFLQQTSLSRSVHLVLHDVDPYVAHAAVRHATTIPTGEHSIFIALPLSMRKDKAFTPWLRSGVTLERARQSNAVKEQMCLMVFNATTQHVHASHAGRHAASFDMRVGGSSRRGLFDTGATCSCISLATALEIDLQLQPAPSNPIIGIGGSATAQFVTTTTVKIGKSQYQHQFFVLEGSIGGYDVLLGEDYLRAVGGAIRLSHDTCSLEIGHDPAALLARITRNLSSSSPVALTATPSVFAQLPCTESPEDIEEITSHNAYKKLRLDIMHGRQIAYKLDLAEFKAASSDSDQAIPECIQQVIDKHSTPDGTLRGDIPFGEHAKGFEMNINIKPDARPVTARHYRLTPAEREVLVKKVDEFVKRRWIEPSTSPWSSTALFVPKPDGGLRFCVDYRFLNDLTVKDKGPLPTIPEILDSMHGKNLFSALDLCSGFYQIPLHPSSRPYTAFPSPSGLYQWRVMPMGLCNSPAVFQAAMNTVLKDHIAAGYCRVYLDDVLIMSNSPEEHARHLDAVLTSLHLHHFYCQLPKCDFALHELRYLGHLVNGSGVRPDPKKIAAIDKWKPPLDVVAQLEQANSSQLKRSLQKQITKQVRSFLGFMQYFSRFLPRFADVAAPLYDLTKDNPPSWSEVCTTNWNTMIQCLVNATQCFHPDFSKPFHVYCDASAFGVGGVLMQQHGDLMHPVAFCARRMQPAELNYTTTEQEFLGLVYCLHGWRCYLEGVHFFIHSDHEPLTWLSTQKSLNRRQCRWLEFLSRFSYRLLYVPGDKNVCADALSRLRNPPVADSSPLPGDTWPHSSPHGVKAALVCTAQYACPHLLLGGHTRARATTVLRDTLVCPPTLAPQAPPPVALPLPAAADPRVRHRVPVDTPPPSTPPSAPQHLTSCGEAPSCGEETNLPHEILYDRLFQRLRGALQLDPATDNPDKRARLSLNTSDDLLWHNNRLYIPDVDNLRNDLLYWHHDVPWICHLGIKRTLEMIKGQFYWPCMQHDIEEYVKSCSSCQRNKTDRIRRTPALSPLVSPDACWRTLGVDLITDLPPSVDTTSSTNTIKYTAICVFVCHLSKMVRLVPTTKDLTTKGFAQLFMREVFAHYGFPTKIVSDRGTQWNSAFFRAMCEEAGVELALSTAYHPQTNGLTERTNEVVEASLRHYISADMHDWHEQLPLVEFALNSSYHDAIKSTPYRMNRITLPASPFETLLERAQTTSTEMSSSLGLPSDLGKRTYVQAHEEFQRARRCVHAAKSRMKAMHDGRGVNSHLYQTGEYVWLSTKNLPVRHSSRRKKLLPRFWGPFLILELIGRNAVRLEFPSHLESMHNVVSVSVLKPYRSRPGVDPGVHVEGELEFQIDQICDHHLVRSRRNVPAVVEFKLRWVDNAEDSWHEPCDLEHAQDVLVEYLEKLPKKTPFQRKCCRSQSF
jgi:hypothetical protein